MNAYIPKNLGSNVKKNWLMILHRLQSLSITIFHANQGIIIGLRILLHKQRECINFNSHKMERVSYCKG
jgi:hypothetical protein